MKFYPLSEGYVIVVRRSLDMFEGLAMVYAIRSEVRKIKIKS